MTTEREAKQAIDDMLSEIDAECIRIGAPILSCLVTFDDGAPSTAFRKSVLKYDLKRKGETLEQCLQRLRKKAYKFRYPAKWDRVASTLKQFDED